MERVPSLRVWSLGILIALILWPAVSAISQGIPVNNARSLTVQVTSPQMNADLGSGAHLILSAEANSPSGRITRVEFFDDDKLVGTATQAPYRLAYHPTEPKLNFRITARATDETGRTAVSPSVTCVATSKVVRSYKSYDYAETAENMYKQVRLWIPEGLKTVRGILVVTNSAGGDSRDSYTEAWYEEFLHLHDFAFLGAKGFSSHEESFQVMQHALRQFSMQSSHPELVNVPYVTTGFSAGGGFASRLLIDAPDKVIACVPVCSRLNFTGITPTVANLRTPACIISGGLEKNGPPFVEPVLEAYRPQGALYSWMTVQGFGHARCGQEVLVMPLLDSAVRLRYPADGDVHSGPLKLKQIAVGSGWVADNTTWQSGLTRISPAKEFTGDIGKSSWLLNQDIAFIYRAYSTYDRPLTITSPSPTWSGHRVWNPGSNVTIVLDDSNFPGWRKLEFYDGAHKLGEITQGYPRFTAMNLASGYHAFSVIGTDRQGRLRPSNPVLVVVRKPAEK